MQLTCECGGTVEIDTSNLGPWAARGLLSPVLALCAECILRRGLVAKREGGLRFVVAGGHEYRLIGGAYVRSENPRSLDLYYRDEK